MRITRLKRNECTRQQLHFFFQAEDGIRDGRVTGVQTCALPISSVQCVPRDSSNTLTTSAGAKKKKMKLACHTMVETPAQAPSQANKRQSRGAVTAAESPTARQAMPTNHIRCRAWRSLPAWKRTRIWVARTRRESAATGRERKLRTTSLAAS